MEVYDVVVVGAGPAGCMVAERLGKNRKVLLVDQLIFPRNKPCGGVLLEESIDFLKRFELPKTVFSEPKILKDLLLLDVDNEIEVRQRRNFLNISRYKFDEFLWQMAIEKSHFMPTTKVVQFYENDEYVDLILEREGKGRISIKTKYLIGADGSPSLIRKNIYGTETSMNGYMATQEWVKSKKKIEDIYFIYDNSIVNSYFWVIPKSNLLVIGVGVPINQGNTSNVIRELKEKVGITKNLGAPEIREAKFTFIPSKVEDIYLGTKRVILVGEAAGLISPSTGEGISYALRSGYYCGEAIEKDFENPQKIYHSKSKSLIKEIGEKIEKYGILSNPKTRAKYLEKLL